MINFPHDDTVTVNMDHNGYEMRCIKDLSDTGSQHDLCFLYVTVHV